MKIVFIGPFGLQPKGTMSVRALPLARALVNRGHKVTVLIPPWDDPDRAGQTWEDNGVQIVNLNLPSRLPLLFHVLLTWRLVHLALKLEPDVIHFFKPKAYAGFAHLALWGLKQIRGYSIRYLVDSDDWEQAWNERLPYSWLQKRLFAWQEIWGLYYADAVIAASRALERLVTANRPGKESTVFYVPNGCQCPEKGIGKLEMESAISATKIREQWQLGQASTILLYSRFEVFRPGRLVDLVGHVAQMMPEARWLCVGQGLYGEDQVVAKQLSQAGLEQYVHFAGWQPAELLPAYFQAADVAAFPLDDTLINRTKCSVKLIDLLMAGVPVVADAVGQNRVYIKNNESGQLVPAGDDLAFSQTLVEVLQVSELRHKLGQAAAQRMCRKFSLESFCLRM